MKLTNAYRLRAYRTRTHTAWEEIAKETGLSIKTLQNCENGKPRIPNKKIVSFLDQKEQVARRMVDLNDPDAIPEYYVESKWESGAVIKSNMKFYLVLEPVIGLYGGPLPEGGIYIPDDTLQPQFKKHEYAFVHGLKYRHYLTIGRWYLIVCKSYSIAMGRLDEIHSDETILLHRTHKKYSGHIVERSVIKAVFELTGSAHK